MSSNYYPAHFEAAGLALGLLFWHPANWTPSDELNHPLTHLVIWHTMCSDIKTHLFHKEKSNKMQQCNKILLFHVYIKLNMFRATHRPSSGA